MVSMSSWVRVLVCAAVMVGCSTKQEPPTDAPMDSAEPVDQWYADLDEVRDADALARVRFVSLDPDQPMFRVADQLISLRLDEEGTLQDWTTLLEEQRLSVVKSHPGRRIVFLELGEPVTTRAELEEILAEIEANPSVRWAWDEPIGYPASLPPGVTPDNRDVVSPHLAVGAHRLWALRDYTGALAHSGVMVDGPDIMVIDTFGDGVPDPDLFEGVYDPADLFQVKAGKTPTAHGYQVLSVLSPKFDALVPTPFAAETDLQAGPITHTHQVWPKDLLIAGTVFSVLDDSIKLPQTIGRNVVVQQAATVCCTDDRCFDRLTEKALTFRGELAADGKGDQILYVVAAANHRSRCVRPPPNDNASSASLVARAELPNSLVVESQYFEPASATPDVSSEADPLYQFCLSDNSYTNGTLSAPADDLWVYDSEGTPSRSLGTSFAAPQAAGAATVLWQHAPTLSASDVADRIKATARPFDQLRHSDHEYCASVEPAPLLDSHQAVLSADLGMPSAPLRRHLLDVDGNGRFDSADLVRFLDHYSDPAVFNQPTFDGFDLNGDGKVGSLSKTAYDLDAPFVPSGTNLPVFESAPAEFTDEEGNTIYATYDETQVSDLDILCYYAYSDLFHQPDALERNRILYDTYADRGLSCPTLNVRIQATTQVCPLSSMYGEWFGVGVWMAPGGAFPVTVRMTAQGDATLDTDPPDALPAVYVPPGARSNPKTLTATDPGMVVYGTLDDPDGTVTVDIEFSQVDDSGTHHVVKTEQVVITARPEAECEVEGVATLGVPVGNQGWTLRQASGGASSAEGYSSSGSTLVLSWMSRSNGAWEFGTRGVTESTTWTDTARGPTTESSHQHWTRLSVYDPTNSTITTFTVSALVVNGVVRQSTGPSTTTQTCSGSSCWGRPTPDLDPICTAFGDILGYDGGTYASHGNRPTRPGGTSSSWQVLQCQGCEGRSTKGCTCPLNGGGRPECR